MRHETADARTPTPSRIENGNPVPKIDAWMKRKVVHVRPLDSVVLARQLLEQHRINQMPVVVDGGLVGIVTDRDLRDAFPSVLETLHRRRSRIPGTDPASIPVEDVMTANVVTLAPDLPMAEAARTMRRERIGAIPIVEHGRLVGILTRSDVLDCLVAVAGG